MSEATTVRRACTSDNPGCQPAPVAMNEPILHHYKESPYAEKARALLGYKQLAWRSVDVPRIAPKPDLVALTGGYRKVPVLQIGADIYCDTRLIAWLLEARHPQPTLDADAGSWGDIVENWVDVNLFSKAVAYTLGRNVDHLDDAFLADRSALSGWPMERAALKGNLPLAEQVLTREIAWIENGLTGRLFVHGAHPGGADFTLYSTLWFARNGRFDFSAFPAIEAWFERMRGFGRGTPTQMTAEEALAVAAAAEPADLGYESRSPDASGAALGQMVSVTPELLGKGTSVEGLLVGIDARHLTVSVDTLRAGRVHVHFPRVGYRLRVTG
ncbi:MAG: glutathione S-transferase family protein [Aquabacterium sp.]|nr:MAG: glutathione S-transferase family protein [Aquabacterium sp.]